MIYIANSSKDLFTTDKTELTPYVCMDVLTDEETLALIEADYINR